MLSHVHSARILARVVRQDSGLTHPFPYPFEITHHHYFKAPRRRMMSFRISQRTYSENVRSSSRQISMARLCRSFAIEIAVLMLSSPRFFSWVVLLMVPSSFYAVIGFTTPACASSRRITIYFTSVVDMG